MPMMNEMTKLLNKIERRLGTKQLNLPEYLQKDKWATEVICNDTLDTFSRYFPHKIPYVLGPENKKGPFYLIDESICESVTILGAGDINWRDWSHHYPGLMYGGVNSYDMMTSGVDFETFADVQMMADHVSAFSNGIYVEFYPPNRIKLNIVISSSFLTNFQRIPIDLFVKHSDNLKTIPPTQMETFERLATADVATFIFEQLKMYDQLEMVYANVDLKLSSLEEKARERREVVDYLEQNYVSAANKNQPIMITVN
jgi:hypothetical protein